ncbi:MAG: segregation and condensation protein A [Bacteriovoracaceae bacterium]
MLDTSIQIKTDRFDGPLSLLLMLIQKEQVEIRDLSLTKITEQYLEYLDRMQELNFNIAGDYLYLAATLIYLKSKECLTEQDKEALGQFEAGSDKLVIESQAELIQRLEDLQRYQKLGQLLWKLPKKGEDIFTRPRLNKKYHFSSFLKRIDVEELTLSMMDYLVRESRKYKVVKRDRLSIKEKLVFLKNLLNVGETKTLDEIIGVQNDGTITNVVINFISLLELARLKRIEVFQNEDRGSVYFKVVKELDDLDLASANGFEDENEQENTEENKENSEQEQIALSQEENSDVVQQANIEDNVASPLMQ